MTGLRPAEPLVGTVLNGRFRLTRLLGTGGMGSVYEAESLSGEAKRAIKLLRQDLVHEDQIVRRFLAEAVAVRELRHPNVAQVLDAATTENGTPYLVMELLQGTPLSRYIEHGHVLPPQQAVQIIRGVLRALGAAHSRNVIHRDIKPENIFLVRDPSGAFVVKVLDFGIAKVMDGAGKKGPMTRTGVLLGTPGYMSPEQIKSSKAVDPRTDLWSAGVILYELITGQPPFPADNELGRLSAVLDDEMRPIERVAPHLVVWHPFFERALAKDPMARFASADEMERALLSTAQSALAPSSVQALADGPRLSTPLHGWVHSPDGHASSNGGTPDLGSDDHANGLSFPTALTGAAPDARGLSPTIAAGPLDASMDLPGENQPRHRPSFAAVGCRPNRVQPKTNGRTVVARGFGGRSSFRVWRGRRRVDRLVMKATAARRSMLKLLAAASTSATALGREPASRGQTTSQMAGVPLGHRRLGLSTFTSTSRGRSISNGGDRRLTKGKPRLLTWSKVATSGSCSRSISPTAPMRTAPRLRTPTLFLAA